VVLPLLKKLIFLANFVLKLLLKEILTNFVMKKICRKLLPIVLQNILYKILFASNFVRNNYLRRNYLQIRFLEKNSRKKYFLAIFFNKFAREFPCNIFNSVLSGLV